MRSRFNYVFALTAAAALTLGLATTGFSQAGAAPAAPALNAGGGQRGQQPAAPAPPTPRRPDGKPIMGSIPGQPAGRWSGCCTELTQGQADKVPFQQWARDTYAQRRIDEFEPHTRCKASGAARQFATPYGTELVEIPDLQRIYIMDNGGPMSYRIIYMDGRSFPADITPTYYGYSIGRWDGDSLVVESRGFNEKFWIDRLGTPHTHQLKFTERFTRVNMNSMQYQATIDDPGAYTAPWTTNVFNMRWAPEADLFEYICQDNNMGPELMLGSQTEVDRTRIFVP